MNLMYKSALLSTIAASAFNEEAWRSRSVYQVLTDRFAAGSHELTKSKECPDLWKYCGGTWKGLQENLDYIADMGFDAIWISPIVKNNDLRTKTHEIDGYHGYWAVDFDAVNENFGTE